MTQEVVIAQRVTGPNEAKLYDVPVGYTLTVEEIQINASEFPYTLYHRADGTIETPPISYGDGVIFLRQGVPNTPDVPNGIIAPTPKPGQSNNNVIFGQPAPSTAPNPTLAFQPVEITGLRSISIIPPPSGSVEVRIYGKLEPSI